MYLAVGATIVGQALLLGELILLPYAVEPVFAHTKYIRRSDRFLRRGLPAWRAEWQLIAATHNLLKLWRAGLAGAETAPSKALALAS